MDELNESIELSAASEPEIPTPEASEPEITESEVPEPEISESGVPEPEVSESEVPEPEISESEVPEPEISESEVPEPEVSESELPTQVESESETSDPVPTDSGDGQLAELSRQLDELRERFEQQRRAMERMSRECDEFSELYPDRPLASLPREVWENVRAGIPLAAAYAYSEARREHAERQAEQVNRRNDAASAGDVSGGTADYFSPAEVRGMTPAEVRANYSKIMNSISRWS